MINFFIVLGTFFFMEFVAWFTHKFIMHGLLWKFHLDHHDHSNTGFFEKNDFFFVIFALPGASCIILGFVYQLPIAQGIGFGISAYGLCYFLVHDVLIHRRFKWFRNADNFYFRAIRRAHKIHHKSIKKEDGQCFGMLIVPLKYFRLTAKTK